MYYEVTIEFDKPNTIISLSSRNIYLHKTIISCEYVYGINPFFDILFYVSQQTNIVIVPLKTKYSIRFLQQHSAQTVYNSIMNYIRDSESCEIL